MEHSTSYYVVRTVARATTKSILVSALFLGPTLIACTILGAMGITPQ